jgi:hypothetical protein
MFSLRSSQLVSIALLVATAAEMAAARDLFVNNVVGQDTNRGSRAVQRSGDGPVRTLDQALRLVRRGDRIVIANTGEPYREMISICDVGQRGYSDLPLVIQGNGATLDGTVVAADGAWKHENDNIYSYRPRRLTYQQMFLDGKPLARVRSEYYSGGVLPLKPLEWTLLADRIAFRVEEGKLPEQYSLRHAGLQTGITLYNTENVRIESRHPGLSAGRRQCARAGAKLRVSSGGVPGERAEWDQRGRSFTGDARRLQVLRQRAVAAPRGRAGPGVSARVRLRRRQQGRALGGGTRWTGCCRWRALRPKVRQ